MPDENGNEELKDVDPATDTIDPAKLETWWDDNPKKLLDMIAKRMAMPPNHSLNDILGSLDNFIAAGRSQTFQLAQEKSYGYGRFFTEEQLGDLLNRRILDSFSAVLQSLIFVNTHRHAAKNIGAEVCKTICFPGSHSSNSALEEELETVINRIIDALKATKETQDAERNPESADTRSERTAPGGEADPGH